MHTYQDFSSQTAAFTTSADQLSYIKISGDDAVNFLQGQLTVDVTKMAPGDIRYTAQCDAKGKMVGLGFLFFNADHFLFIQHAETIDASLQQLQKFGVFAKAEFTLKPETTKGFALVNGYEIPIDQNMIITPFLPGLEDVKLVWSDDAQFVTDAQAASLLTALFIVRGIALLESDMQEQFVPQMLNVQAVNGIDFDKGCYMGQEVVARTRYLGKNKRGMFAFTLANNDSLHVHVGQNVMKKLGDNWRKVGTVISHTAFKDQHIMALVLPNDTSNEDTLAIENANEHPLKALNLPYVVELETSTIKQRKRND